MGTLYLFGVFVVRAVVCECSIFAIGREVEQDADDNKLL